VPSTPTRQSSPPRPKNTGGGADEAGAALEALEALEAPATVPTLETLAPGATALDALAAFEALGAAGDAVAGEAPRDAHATSEPRASDTKIPEVRREGRIDTNACVDGKGA
jgi:hypothetical protein